VSFVHGVPASAIQSAVPLKGGAPGEMVPYILTLPPKPSPDFAVNPQLAFPTRAPGTPVEAFAPGKFLNSGIVMKQPPAPGAPPNDTFQLTFTTPGTYSYVCAIHLLPMGGTVEVLPATASDVPDQAALTTQGQTEIKALMDLLPQAEQQGSKARTEPGPSGTNFVYVRAGSNEAISAEDRAQSFAFLPQDITIKAGDTVVWGSAYFHTVTFNPTPPNPEFIEVRPPASGQQLPQIVITAKTATPAKPAATYDPTKFFNSGILGPFSLDGFSWALTFDKPGTYPYFCAVHQDEGMKGNVIVQPK